MGNCCLTMAGEPSEPVKKCCLHDADCSWTMCARSDLTDEEAELIRRRSGLRRIDFICAHHKKYYLIHFPLSHKCCCDPFALHKGAVVKHLREISIEFANDCTTNRVFSSPLIPGKKLCVNCVKNCQTRIDVFKECAQSLRDQSAPNPVPSKHVDARHVESVAGRSTSVAGSSSENDPTTKSPNEEAYDEIFPTPPDVALSDLNKCLTLMGLGALDYKLLTKSKTYVENRFDEFKGKIINKLERAHGDTLPSLRGCDDFQQIMDQLHARFLGTNDRHLQIQVLSVLPQSWSVNKILAQFETSEHNVRQMKTLVQNQGVIPSLPSVRSRSGLKPGLAEKVKKHYYDNSRELPGKKDFKSVKGADGKRVHKQKRLVLLNLKELYSLFMAENPEEKISFSKFADLRPPECVLAGASGTHSVCVCVHHENFLLKCEAVNFEKTDEDGKMKRMSLSEIFGLVLCPEPNADCYFRNCDKCPGIDTLRDIMEPKLVTSEDSSVQFKKWTSTDRAHLETVVETATDFIDNFIESVPAVLKHHYISKAQAAFLAHCKKTLQEDEVIVTGDFSENYSPVVQDAIQGVHWSKEQITIHPFVCYAKVDGELKVINYVVVSDTRDHTNPTVYSFLRQLVPFLKSQIKGLKRIKYFSDGAASQYKNRTNASNLRKHFLDFNVEAEWHFFASCHGKGPCDGLGGTIKREAARESLQRVRQDGILNAQQLYEWAALKFKDSMTIKFLSKADISVITYQFKERFEDPTALDGIKSSHCLIPKSPNMILMKEYSDAPSCQYVYCGNREEAKFEDSFGFVIVIHLNSWQVAFVEDRDEENQLLAVILLEHAGRRRYKFPAECKTVTKSPEDVIAILNMDGDENGFILATKDSKLANAKLQNRASSSSAQNQDKKKKK